MKKHVEFKESGIVGIGEVPEHWKVKKLKYIADNVLTGSTPPSNNSEYFENGEFDWFTPVDFTNFILTNSKRKVSELAIRDGVVKIYPANTILMVGIGATLGKVGLLETASSSNQQINAIVCKEQHIPLYYLYFLYIQRCTIAGTTNSATLAILNQFQTKDIYVPVPPENEQLLIVNYINCHCEKIDKLIRIKIQLIELLNEEKAAIINSAVTKGVDRDAPMKPSGVEWLGDVPIHWEVKRLKYIAEIFRGKFTHRPRNDEKLYGGPYPFIQTGDVAKAGKFLTEYTQTLNEDGYKVTTEFPAGTLVMTIAANIGEVAILGFDGCFPDSVVGFYPFIMDKEFLYYKLISLKQVFLSTSIVNTQMNLNVERISGVHMSYPSVAEQRQIVHFIESAIQKIDSAVDKIEKEISLLSEYKQSLIYEAVTGKVKVDTPVEKFEAAV